MLSNNEEFAQHMTKCFQQMGTDTREFVVNHVKNELNILLDNDIESFKALIDTIKTELDGDPNKPGFQIYNQLIQRVTALENKNIGIDNFKLQIANYFNSLDGAQLIFNLLFNNNSFITRIVNNSSFVTMLVENNKFITSITSNNTYLTKISNNVIIEIVNQIQNDTSISNQLKSSLISLIESRIQELRLYLDREIHKIKNNCDQNYLELENQIKGFQAWINNFSNISLDRNVTIIGIQNSITELNNSITELKQNFVSREELDGYITKQSLAAACEAFKLGLLKA